MKIEYAHVHNNFRAKIIKKILRIIHVKNYKQYLTKCDKINPIYAFSLK